MMSLALPAGRNDKKLRSWEEGPVVTLLRLCQSVKLCRVSPKTAVQVTLIFPGISALQSVLMSSVLHVIARCAGTWTKELTDSRDENTVCQTDHQLIGTLSSAFPWLFSFIIVAKLRRRAGLDGEYFLVRL